MNLLFMYDNWTFTVTLIDELQNSDWVVAYKARAELIKCGHSAIKPLMGVLASSDKQAVSLAIGALGEIGDASIVDSLIKLLASADANIQEEAWRALAKINDFKSIQPLIKALANSNVNVQEIVARILGKIVLKILPKPSAYDLLLAISLQTADKKLGELAGSTLQHYEPVWLAPLLDSYPHVFCSSCHFRATKKSVRISLMRRKQVLACRSCGNLGNLLANVREVVGIIGGDGKAFEQNGNIVMVNLWNEPDANTHNADIDRLLICSSGVAHYDQAITAVINTLKNDTSRPSKWCKSIQVDCENTVILPPGAKAMLKDSFKSIAYVPALPTELS